MFIWQLCGNMVAIEFYGSVARGLGSSGTGESGSQRIAMSNRDGLRLETYLRTQSAQNLC